MGIGLSLVKSIVELHAGRIEVHSQGLGQGVEFKVRLPIVVVAPQPEPAAPSTNGHARHSRQKRVLIVDDNVAATSLLSVLIKKQGHDVYVAHDGLEAAVEAAGHFRPHIVLMDLGMPKLNGYEAARRIRSEPWGREMLLVAVTGWGQESDKQQTTDAGFDHHLVKPARPDAIQQLLSNPPASKDVAFPTSSSDTRHIL